MGKKLFAQCFMYVSCSKNNAISDTLMLRTTQVLDNHVIRYVPPEEYAKSIIGAKVFRNRKPLGCLVVGAEAANPDRVRMWLPLLMSFAKFLLIHLTYLF